ncbi:protein DJ-1 homolog D-like [Arachis ipaensis]|uniref:protein DJ-1 homolog D-like n=1 Tax=Arachis ipaensis TaxID=130454 RepID=UPI000A2AF801|nr:protein DJ-1 homolog D-like [Arachis ipaensis]
MLLRLLHIGKSETRGHNFVLNAKFAEIDAANYDELLLLGGRAPEYLAHDPLVVALVIKFFSSGKALASICHRQLILAAAGVAKDRKCTAFPPVKPTLVASGARWVEPDTMAATVVDGNLIAAATYEGHPEFIQHIMKALGGNISGSNKKILYICRKGIHCNYFRWAEDDEFEGLEHLGEVKTEAQMESDAALLNHNISWRMMTLEAEWEVKQLL